MAANLDQELCLKQFRDRLRAEPDLGVGAIRDYWAACPGDLAERLETLVLLLDMHMGAVTGTGRRVCMREYATAFPELGNGQLQELYGLQREYELKGNLAAPAEDPSLPK